EGPARAGIDRRLRKRSVASSPAVVSAPRTPAPRSSTSRRKLSVPRSTRWRARIPQRDRCRRRAVPVSFPPRGGPPMPLRPGLKPSPLAVHAGARVDPATGSPTPPVYRTAAFAFASVDEMIDTFAGRRERFIYSRYANPTVVEAEERLAALEGA